MLYAICYMLYAICYMLYAICYTRYAIYYMPFAIRDMLYAICYYLILRLDDVVCIKQVDEPVFGTVDINQLWIIGIVWPARSVPAVVDQC